MSAHDYKEVTYTKCNNPDCKRKDFIKEVCYCAGKKFPHYNTRVIPCPCANRHNNRMKREVAEKRY